MQRQVVGKREMLVNHADAGRECRGRVAGCQRLAEHLDRSRVGNVMAEQDRYERGLSGAVLAEQREHFTARERQRDRIVGNEVAEALGGGASPGAPTAGRGRHFVVDLGSVSTTATFSLPSRISFSFALTFACRSAGTFAANVPSGASSDPLFFISEYWP